MNQKGQWWVAGSAPEVYERELVPAVFGVWAPILVELAQPPQASALSMLRSASDPAPIHRRQAARWRAALRYLESAPPAIGHARSRGVSCEMMGASVARSTA